ncbi:Bug family tripartite tricarboxylate transporter substrate binding protein [Cupriavidus sp. NPDC089707]|uniref:Bug family tripartite tricarboxylate transporter substrate binding protein n=1 Tax=Cupriavidus sp. NPDC089707 TaxID=3363963 RepID=UPI00380A5732
MYNKLLGGCALTLCAAGVFATTAIAADAPYPSRPITFVLSGPPGGAGDTVARQLAEDLGARLGQPIVVDNKPGAAGIIGTNAVAKAAPDGYTILITVTQSVLNNRFLFSRLPYDPLRDLTFITEVAGGNMLMTVSSSLPVTNVKELLAYGSKHGLSFANWGAGSYAHLVASYLGKSRNLDVTPIAYKGEAPILQDIAGGNVNVGISSLNTTLPFLQSGRVRAIGATGKDRLATLPNVPTLAEQGLAEPEYDMSGIIVMMAPAGTPAPILERLEKDARAAIDSAKFRDRMQLLGFYPLGGGARQARKHYEEMYPVQQRLVKISGAKLD